MIKPTASKFEKTFKTKSPISTTTPLRRYNVKVDDKTDTVLVDIDQDQVKPEDSHHTPDGLEHIVIIGSGAGGVSAAEELLKLNFNGKITIVSSDDHQPYDRNGLNQCKNASQTIFLNVILQPI